MTSIYLSKPLRLKKKHALSDDLEIQVLDFICVSYISYKPSCTIHVLEYVSSILGKTLSSGWKHSFFERHADSLAEVKVNPDNIWSSFERSGVIQDLSFQPPIIMFGEKQILKNIDGLQSINISFSDNQENYSLKRRMIKFSLIIKKIFKIIINQFKKLILIINMI